MKAEDSIKLWERAIETQMHFAELSIKMRQLGLTLAGATLALAVVLYRTGGEFSIEIQFLCLSIPIGSILCFVAAGILYGAKTIDVDVYHQMLRGAVRFNEELEKSLDQEFCWKTGITETISAHSRYKYPELLDERDENGKIWRNGLGKNNMPPKSINASRKISRFYYVSIASLTFAGLSLVVLDSV